MHSRLSNDKNNRPNSRSIKMPMKEPFYNKPRSRRVLFLYYEIKKENTSIFHEYFDEVFTS